MILILLLIIMMIITILLPLLIAGALRGGRGGRRGEGVGLYIYIYIYIYIYRERERESCLLHALWSRVRGEEFGAIMQEKLGGRLRSETPAAPGVRFDPEGRCAQTGGRKRGGASLNKRGCPGAVQRDRLTGPRWAPA